MREFHMWRIKEAPWPYVNLNLIHVVSFQVRRTCTSLLLVASVVGWTDCRPPPVATWCWLPSRRASPSYARKVLLLLPCAATSSDILGTFVEASHHFTEGSVIVAEHTSTLQPYLACVCNGFKVSRLNTKLPEEINWYTCQCTCYMSHSAEMKSWAISAFLLRGFYHGHHTASWL